VSKESDDFESVGHRVAEIFDRVVGERAQRLNGSVVASEAMDVISAALAPEYGVEKAGEIAFHMADWNADAAFIVALHLFPEKFTAAEIDAGIGLFLSHAPSHIRAACGLTGQIQWVDFYE
jgi:hypothetical protein